jgi:hypothetical protein
MATGKRQWQVGVGVLIGVVVLGAAQGARAQSDDSGSVPGFVPPDAATLKCESGVANNVSKLRACAEKCHIKAATAALAGKTFDEEACEKTDPAKSCLAQYNASVAKLVGCPTCLDATQQANLTVAAEFVLDGGRGAIYCAGSTPF